MPSDLIGDPDPASVPSAFDDCRARVPGLGCSTTVVISFLPVSSHPLGRGDGFFYVSFPGVSLSPFVSQISIPRIETMPVIVEDAPRRADVVEPR